MANLCELKLPVSDLRASGGEQALLRGIVLKELAIVATRLRMDVSMVLHLVDKAVERLQEEMKKFSNDPDKPYPPVGKHELILYVTMPEVGKLAQGVEWRERIIV